MEVDDFSFAKRKPQKCPNCGSSRIADIIYGMPSFEMYDSPDYGEKYVTGGCCISEADPKWRCLECDNSIYPEKARKILEAMPPPF